MLGAKCGDTIFLDAMTEKPGNVGGTISHSVAFPVTLDWLMTERQARRKAARSLRKFLGRKFGRVTKVSWSVCRERGV